MSSNPTSRSTLRRGDTGTAVQDLQRALGIEADGNFGPETEHAIREFQANAGLTVDGAANAETNEKLFADDTAKVWKEFREDE